MPKYTIKPATVVGLSAGVAKTVLSIITPATRRAWIRRLTLGGLSVTSTDVPGTIEFVQFDSDGTGTAVTPTALDRAETAALCTAKSHYTVEPSTNPVVISLFPLSPQGNTAEKAFDLLSPLVMPISKILGVRITMPQAQSFWPELEYEE